MEGGWTFGSKHTLNNQRWYNCSNKYIMSSFTVTVICIRDIFVTVMLTHIQGSPYARNMSKHVKCIHLFNSHQKNTKNNTLKGGHSCYSHYKFYLSTFYHNLFGLCCLMCVCIISNSLVWETTTTVIKSPGPSFFSHSLFLQFSKVKERTCKYSTNLMTAQ